MGTYLRKMDSGTLNIATKFQGENKGQCGVSGKYNLIAKGTKQQSNVCAIGANMATEWQEKEEQKPKRETRWAKIVEKFCRQMGTVAG